ncbi:transposase [Reichenbachiella sp.]|uniref:REP-associated tyrosine transposase n=1 Tax=Reichenbachiella sp. TaxID=2184521 RepID=UPI003298A5F0
MSRKYKFRNPDGLYFVSFAVVHWIDLLVREEYKIVILDSLKYCQKKKGLEIYAWCLMTSHVHVIIGSTTIKLADVLRDFKKHTSKALRHAIVTHPQESRKEWMIWMMERAGRKNGNNVNWQLWQQHNHPIELSNNQMMEQRLDYIHHNPVIAGFVNEPEHWRYSSAIDYAGGKGQIDVRFME